MRELMVDPEESGDAGTKKCRYRYSILIDEMKVSEGFACESYGVKVTDLLGGNYASIPHITVSISRIDCLIELLIHNSVTPVTLRDVVEDWL